MSADRCPNGHGELEPRVIETDHVGPHRACATCGYMRGVRGPRLEDEAEDLQLILGYSTKAEARADTARSRAEIAGPVLVSYGGGTNSTAMLIELAARGEHVSAILFADTGGERQETYDFIAMFSEWLVAHGQPEITIVRHVRRDGTFQSLEDECLEKRRLPSIAYGFKKCSGKFKLEPQTKWTNHWDLARVAWKARRRITKLVGFGIDEQRRADKGNEYQSDAWFKRYASGESARDIALSELGLGDDPPVNPLRNMMRKVLEAIRYRKRYPLIEFGMDRDSCVATIDRAGIRRPGKSACWYCPSSRKPEIRALPIPLQRRAIAMERNAADTLTSVKGLGRSFSWEGFLAGEASHQTSIEFPCECTDGDDEP